MVLASDVNQNIITDHHIGDSRWMCRHGWWWHSAGICSAMLINGTDRWLAAAAGGGDVGDKMQLQAAHSSSGGGSGSSSSGSSGGAQQQSTNCTPLQLEQLLLVSHTIVPWWWWRCSTSTHRCRVLSLDVKTISSRSPSCISVQTTTGSDQAALSSAADRQWAMQPLPRRAIQRTVRSN